MSVTRDTTKFDMLADGWEITDGTETVVLSFPDLDVKVRIDKDGLADSTDFIRRRDAPDFCSEEIAHAHEVGYGEGLAEARAEIDSDGAHKALEDWHNAHHESVLRFCYEEPCKPIRDALERPE